MSFSNEVRVMLDGTLIDYSRPNHAKSKFSRPDHSPLDELPDPSASTAPADSDGRLIDRSLRLADDQEVVRQMAYVLRSWPRARGRRRGDEALARVTAERLVDYLHLSGFELMKRPVATDTGYIGGGL